MKIMRNLLLGFGIALALAACGQPTHQRVRAQHATVYLSADGSTAYTRAYDDDLNQLIWYQIILSDTQRGQPLTASSFSGSTWSRTTEPPEADTLQETDFAVAELDGSPATDLVDADTVEASETISSETSVEQAADIGGYSESIGSDGDGNMGGGSASEGGGYESGSDSGGSYDSGGGSYDSGGGSDGGGGGGDF